MLSANFTMNRRKRVGLYNRRNALPTSANTKHTLEYYSDIHDLPKICITLGFLSYLLHPFDLGGMDTQVCLTIVLVSEL